MAWNEPGGNDGKDPWGRRDNEPGPPDLDEIVKKMQEKLGGLFGGGGRDNNHNGDGGGNVTGPVFNPILIAVMGVVLLVVWGLFGFYTVQPAEQGVVLRFGKYVKTTEQGLNWYFPYPVGEVIKVNVDELRAVRHKALMLTKDENLVEIELVVQYKVADAYNYLFNVREPDNTLRQATESALREVVGMSLMDTASEDAPHPLEDHKAALAADEAAARAAQSPPASADTPPAQTAQTASDDAQADEKSDTETVADILTAGRSRAALMTRDLIQEILNRYQTGLTVRSVNMQDAQPPEAVQDAFADAIKAREDEERHKNKAEAYRNEVVQQASGMADRMIQEAEAYKSQVVNHAIGETKRFLSVLVEYQKAPEITRKRLYLETMEDVLSKTNKVMVDIEQGNPLLFLPLDRLTQNLSAPAAPSGYAPEALDNGHRAPSEPLRPGRESSRYDRRSR